MNPEICYKCDDVISYLRQRIELIEKLKADLQTTELDDIKRKYYENEPWNRNGNGEAIYEPYCLGELDEMIGLDVYNPNRPEGYEPYEPLSWQSRESSPVHYEQFNN